jgi:hypothetical protein
MIKTTLPIALLASFFLGACASMSSDMPTGEHVGEPLQNLDIHPLAEVQSAPATYADQTLLVEARVVDVCQSMGCWMQVADDQGRKALVRWEAGCGGQYQFPKDAAGERILIQGSFYEKNIAKEDIEHLQGEASGDLEIPEKGYEMNASAVVLLDRKGE